MFSLYRKLAYIKIIKNQDGAISSKKNGAFLTNRLYTSCSTMNFNEIISIFLNIKPNVEPPVTWRNQTKIQEIGGDESHSSQAWTDLGANM
jgi:hypothetical protein